MPLRNSEPPLSHGSEREVLDSDSSTPADGCHSLIESVPHVPSTPHASGGSNVHRSSSGEGWANGFSFSFRSSDRSHGAPPNTSPSFASEAPQLVPGGVALGPSFATLRQCHSATNLKRKSERRFSGEHTPPLPLEPSNILEVNKSLNRSFHATPVIESQSVEKRTIVRKTQKLLNDKYVLYPKQELGRGSYGKVVLCYSIEEEVYFAVKILRRHQLRRQGLGADSALLHVHKELDVLKRLRHDNIIALHEFIDDGVSPKIYMVFELAAYGEVLRLTKTGSLAEGEEPLPEKEVRRVIKCVADALAFAHEAGVAHRDVKPENILVTSTHAIKLGDFGCAVADVADGDPINRGGSVAFLPPELLTKDTVLSRATSNVGRLVRAASTSSSRNSTWHRVNTQLELESPQTEAGACSSSAAAGNDADATSASCPPATTLAEIFVHRTDSNATAASTSAHLVGTPSNRQQSQNSAWTCGSNYNLAPSSGAEFSACGTGFGEGRDGGQPLSTESSVSLLAFDDCTPTRAGGLLSMPPAGAPQHATSLVDFFKADVWSLGITTFALLFGQLPWQAHDSASLAAMMSDHKDPFYALLDGPLASSSDDDDDDDGSDSDFEDVVLEYAECSRQFVPTRAFTSKRPTSDDALEATSSMATDAATPKGRRQVGGHTRRNAQRSGRGFRSDVPHVSDACIDFVRMCLTVDPDCRPSAAELALHPWFAPNCRRATLSPQSAPCVENASPVVSAAPVRTSQLTLRVLEGEEHEVPVELKALLQAKHLGGPSKQRLALRYFASPTEKTTAPLSMKSAASSPQQAHAPSPTSTKTFGRSKDDSVIFAEVSQDAYTTPTTSSPKVADASRQLQVAIEASGASPYGLRTRRLPLCSDPPAANATAWPPAPLAHLRGAQSVEALQRSNDGCGTIDNETTENGQSRLGRRLTLRDIVEAQAALDLAKSQQTHRAMKHVCSGPL